ncbi:LolA family protein [Peribacillus butanolivorans]|uniref:LolA family protein n=1 Tax=Peribacillus butanolivorans TaxID=421767 RepID=UPI00368B707D
MKNKIKQELENIEIPKEFEQISQNGINKAYSEMNNNRKKSRWLIGFVACAAILLLSIGSWSTPVVKASIQNALNLILADKFEKMEKGSRIPPEEVLVSVEENSKGELITTYISGSKERTENENGDFSVSDGKTIASYTKNDNKFIIEANDNPGPPIESKIFSEFEKEKIQSLGTKTLLDRNAEVYKITITGEETLELWFDKATDVLVREIQIIDGKTYEEGKLISLKTIDKKSNLELFRIEAPKEANIIDHTKK